MPTGAFTEGFDWLWEAHFLRDLSFPQMKHLTPVMWFGIINIGVSLLGPGAPQPARREIIMTDHQQVGRALL